MSTTAAPLPRPGTTTPIHSAKQRAGLLADLRSLPRAEVHAAVRSLVAQALGRRCPHGVVLAWVGLVLAVLYSDTGTTRQGLAELAAKAGVTRQTMTAYRKRMMPPEGGGSRWPTHRPDPGSQSRDGLLVRPFRGRPGHGVSKWAIGDGLLVAVLARLRDQRDRSRRSSVRKESRHVAAPGTVAGPAGPPLAAQQPAADGPAGRSPTTTTAWDALRTELAARRRLRR